MKLARRASGINLDLPAEKPAIHHLIYDTEMFNERENRTKHKYVMLKH
jgi:hypothetical protein